MTSSILRTRLWTWAGLLVVLVTVVLVAGRPATPGRPFDPTSTGPAGTAALVELVESVGGRANLALAPSSDAQTALLARDWLPEEPRRSLDRWVRQGGTLVLADPTSPLAGVEPAPQSLGMGVAPAVYEAECARIGLAEVDEVSLAGQQALEVPTQATGCVSVGEGSWLVARPVGSGTVVVLGGGRALTNELLGEADNAVLAVSLLAPGQGTRTTILRRPRPGEGDQTLADLVPGQVWAAVWLAMAAFGVYALAQGRRVGRPVAERLPVRVSGSDLTVGVGNLLQRGGNRADAARRLRESVADDVAAHLGLPPHTDAGALLERARTRGADAAWLPDTLEVALDPRPPESDADLLACARAAADARQVLRTGPRSPSPSE